MSEKIPEAISEEVLDIAGIKIRVYVLDDGRRIIHADDVEKLLEFMVTKEDV